MRLFYGFVQVWVDLTWKTHMRRMWRVKKYWYQRMPDNETPKGIEYQVRVLAYTFKLQKYKDSRGDLNGQPPIQTS